MANAARKCLKVELCCLIDLEHQNVLFPQKHQNNRNTADWLLKGAKRIPV